MRRSGYLVILVVVLLLVEPGLAGTTRTWSPDTAEEFARGTLDGTSIFAGEGVCLAQVTETVWGPEVGIVWAVLDGNDEGAFVALSEPGRVLFAGGGKDPAIWFEGGGEELVTALAPDGPGKIVFGLSPTGMVMRTGRDGEAEVVVETGAEYVWALARGKGGKLWIGTGSPGKLMVADDAGEVVQNVHESGDDPVRSVAAMPDGGVVAGTGRRGLVLRVHGSGEKAVLLDAEEEEIVSVHPAADGSVWALAARGGKQAAAKPARKEAEEKSDSTSNGGTVTATVHVQPGGPAGSAPAGMASKAAAGSAGGSLYRISPDGEVARVWQSDGEFPHSMVLDPDGTPVIATAGDGRLIRVDPGNEPSVLLSIPSEKATALAIGTEGRLWVGGSDDARLVVVGPGRNEHGEYLGEPVDAGWIADWGVFEWSGTRPEGSLLKFLFRSGNTEEPDDTWSDWNTLPSVKPGVFEQTGVPPARYFQAMVMLGRSPEGRFPVVRSMGVTYLARNRKPRIEKLGVEDPGIAWHRGPSSSPARLGLLLADDPVAREVNGKLASPGNARGPIRKAYEPGARTFHWVARDPDRDELRFSLEIRPEGESDWYPLANDLHDRFHGWDGRGMPDGRYRVRLTADDMPGNPDGGNLVDRKVSEIFTVDGTRPVLERLEVTGGRASFVVNVRAVDLGGVIAALEYALDEDEWRILAPQDGVADSGQEDFRLIIPRPTPPREKRYLAIRVTDRAGNVSGDRVVLE